MKAWCVVVPRERAEETRRRLMEDGLLLKHLRIAQAGDHVLLPTKERVDIGFPAEEHELESGFVAIRSYKEVAQVPDDLRGSLPTSFDVIGDIAVIKIPEALRGYRGEVGRAILRWNPKLRVAAEDRGVKGEHRVRSIEVIAGERRTTTVHTEHGLLYCVDLGRAYFSPRLASERKRIADLVRPGEVVADPFAGVGPYAILIAKRRQPNVVHASDANPVAVELLRANAAANRAELVAPHEGDARRVLKDVTPVDRVILDLPHTAFDYLAEAFGAIGAHGTVHAYRILEHADEQQAEERIRAAGGKAGVRITQLGIHRVRAYSPTQHHLAFDITVDRASRRAGPGTSRNVSRRSRTTGTQA